MSDTTNEVFKTFGNKLRVRVCGICIKDNKVLLINHRGVNTQDEFWAPPGGGMEFGQPVEENLKREFLEETGLTIEVNEFLFINEFIGPPLHAIEIFFNVTITGGNLIIGSEPEMDGDFKIIKDVGFKNWDWVKKNKGVRLHNVLNKVGNISDLYRLNGYILQLKNK